MASDSTSPSQAHREVNVYRVKASGDEWDVTRDGRDSTIWSSPSRDDAITFASRVAHNNRPSRLIVHESDGTIDTEEILDEVSADKPG